MPSIQARLDRALDVIASAVSIAHRIAIFLILLAAFLLSLLFFYIYPLAIIPVLIIAALAILYVNSKKDAISELMEDADEETSIPHEDRPGHYAPSSRALPKRIVMRVLDQVLGSASDTAMLAPLACIAVAVLAFLFDYSNVGIVAGCIAAFLILLVACSCHLAKHISHAWVDRLFGDPHDSHPGKTETTPLVSDANA